MDRERRRNSGTASSASTASTRGRVLKVALALVTVLPLCAASPIASAAVGPSGLLPLSAQGALRWAANLRSAPSVTAPILTLLPASTALSIDGWATDSGGGAWY